MEKPEAFDKNMVPEDISGRQVVWHELPCEPAAVRGLGFYAKEKAWCRLPLESLEGLGAQQPYLPGLARHTAGAAVEFRTDSREVWVRAELNTPPYLSHMAPTGQCGFDCYVRREGEDWKLAGVTKFPVPDKRFKSLAAEHIPPGAEVRINLPLYAGVESLAIGLEPGARLFAPSEPAGKAVAFYGTSITQGGCASRPGMAYPAILERKIGNPTYNFGFSGNGIGLPALAPLFCSLPDLGLLVIDIEANAGPVGMLEQNLPRFIDAVRADRPTLKLLVLSGSPQAEEDWDPVRAKLAAGWRATERMEVDRRRAAGDEAIFFADPCEFAAGIGPEATVDGVHLTDWGFALMAEGLEPIIRGLLAD